MRTARSLFGGTLALQLTAAAVIGGTLTGPVTAQRVEAVADIAGRRELFVDDFLLEDLQGVRLELARPQDRGVALRFDRPWEGPFCGYATVIAHGGRYLLYYRGLPKAGGDGTDLERTCVAISEDGLHFDRPALTQYEVPGVESNNVVLV